MFIKKFLYKITDPRKHHEYKINLAIERKKKWYKLIKEYARLYAISE